MRKSVDFLTPPNHSVAVTGIPNVKQKVVRIELVSKRSFECKGEPKDCLLYTSDAADEDSSV